MYEQLANFAQTWGAVYFTVLFMGVVVYVLWPSKRKQFDDAANVPLRED